MGQLFALFISICMTTGEYQEAVVEVYESEKECQQAMYEKRIYGECSAVEPDGDQHPTKE